MDDSPPLLPTSAALADAALATPLSARTFTNPVCASGADPWVTRWQGAYWYCHARDGSVCVGRASRLHEIGRAPAAVVWTPPAGRPYSCHLWAPELHRLDGRFYVYVAADDGHNRSHRMYVLEGDARDPQQPFALKGRIKDASDRWAIDGTLLLLDDGRRYFLWSGWEGERNEVQSLYCAKLANAWTLAGPRVRISTPDRRWEQRSRPLVNEGPTVLRSREGRVFVVYSASGSWTDDYCLGLLSLVGADPLEPSAWRKSAQPVFARSSRVFGPGHACFVRSPDGREDWIVYHAAKRPGAGWDRDVRMQRFGWRSDGSPEFGIPVPAGMPLDVPSGTR